MRPIQVVQVDGLTSMARGSRILAVWLVEMPISATLLMIGVPLAHDVLGTPDTHPGWLACLALLLLTKILLSPFRRWPLPKATDDVLEQKAEH